MSHAALAGSVGASFFFSTPAFGVSPPIINFFSSAGGVPILFDQFGNRKLTPEFRKQPPVVLGLEDAVRTTLYTNGPNNLHYGTPAAAAHIAGVAALMFTIGKEGQNPWYRAIFFQFWNIPPLIWTTILLLGLILLVTILVRVEVL
jgi:hypothetical protein